MKGGVLHGLRCKRLPISLTIICTALLIWRWERAPLSTTFLPQREIVGKLPPVYFTRSPSVAHLKSKQKPFSTRKSSSDAALDNQPPFAGKGSFDAQEKGASESEEVLGSQSVGGDTKISFTKEGCNYGKGKWVEDERRPLYSGFGCKQWLAESWSCRLTNRQDFSYEKFRWQPDGCEIPEFEGTEFLKRMKGKTIALVGDSLGRQQFQSLMCMVTGGKENLEVEDVGRKYGFVVARGALRPDGWAYRFRSTNTTILYHWSATLCELEPLKRSGPYAMHLDRPAHFLKKYLHRFDVLVLNTGHHWNRGKLKANRWEMYANGKPVTDRKQALIWNAKNLTINSVVRWLDSQLPRHPRLKAFLTTLSPRHFFNGEWNTGGSCDNTNPLAGGHKVSQDNSGDPIAEAAVKGTRVSLLDITALSQLRDEGHISRYSIKATEGVQDCLHWCLPGIPDTWNEILIAQL